MANSRVKDLNLLTSIDVSLDSFLVEDDNANETKRTTLTYIKSALGLTGTNSGDQNVFSSIAVSGQSTVTAGTTSDTVTFVAGSNITITTNAGTKTVTINSSAAGVTDGDKGDITVSGGGATWTIDAGAVSYSKIQNVSATSRVLGRKTAGAGAIEEMTAGEVLDFIGTTQGSILVRTSTGWAELTPGTSGEFLRTNGAGANPSWATPSASATWGSITGTLSSQTDLQAALNAKITAFADPNADRIVFWDDSAGAFAALTASTGLTISGTSMIVRSASASQTGIVELATNAETATGTDTARAVTPAGLASVGYVTASSSATFTNKTFDANGTGNSISNLEVADFTAAAIVTLADTIAANNNDTTIPTSAAVKAYADSVAGAGLSDGDKGDITVSSSGTVWTIDAGAVSYSKIQNVSATSRVLGRKAAGAGVIEELTTSDILDFAGSTQGQILYRGSAGWVALAPGSAGQVLQTNGTGADPSWVTPSGGGGGGGVVLSPSQITSSVDDYTPSSWADSVSILRLSADNFHFLTGLGATSNGHICKLSNVGDFPIGCDIENTSSTAANRFAELFVILPGNTLEVYYDGTTQRWRLTTPYALNLSSPLVAQYYNDAWVVSNNSDMANNASYRQYVTSGTGATAAEGLALSYGGRTGVVELSTGTTATGRASYYTSQNDMLAGTNAATKNQMLEYNDVIMVPNVLSDATNDYLLQFGFYDSDSTTPADGVFFFYNHATNSGNWVLRGTNNTASADVNTSIPVTASTWFHLRVVIYPDQTARGWINGVDVGGALSSSNVPAVTRGFGFGETIRKTAGTTARVLVRDRSGIQIIRKQV